MTIRNNNRNKYLCHCLNLGWHQVCEYLRNFNVLLSELDKLEDNSCFQIFEVFL